ncbi:MAG TPA: HAD-IA family hydrolase [Streptosporangiaceae bacterium]|nr:HAD-IA family hydrolase [Streptosporangiaceae bacterium]
MPVVEAVLLDAGGVLILPSPEVVLPALRAAGVTPRVDVLERAHYRAMAAADGAGPPDLDGAGPPALDGAGGPAVRMDWPHYFAAYATCCGVPRAMVGLVADELAVAVRGGFTWSHVISAAARTLRRITELGNKVAIVSNSDGSVADALCGLGVCHTGPGPAAQVGAVIDSAAVGVSKPDPRIFHLALDALGSRPEHAIHVGDSLRADVEGARAAGIRPVHLDPYEDCPSPGGHEHIRSLDGLTQLISC